MKIDASECIPIEYIKDQIEEYRKFDHLGMYAEFLDMFIQDYKDNAMANYADRKTEPSGYNLKPVEDEPQTEKEQRMSDLIPWEDWIESKNTYFANSEPTQFACPKCGKRIYKKTDIILSCYPPKHQYFCSKCDWVGYA